MNNFSYNTLERSFSENQIREALFRGSQSDVRCTSRERAGPTFVPSLRKLYEATSNQKLDFCRWLYNLQKNVKYQLRKKKLQTDLDRLGDWVEENEMKIGPNKSKALSFTRARVKDPLNYSLGDQKIPVASCCKYLIIII